MWKRRREQLWIVTCLCCDDEKAPLPDPPSDGALREREALRRLLDRIPADSPDPPFDLLPRVRAQLREEPMRAPFWGRQPALGVAASVLVLAGLAYAAVSVEWSARGLDASAGANTVQAASPVLDLLREASALTAQRDFSNAYRVLQTAAESYPDDVHAGEVQQRLADLYFDQFHRYPEAHKAYLVLRQHHRHVWERKPENTERLNLLAEAQRDNYASLEMLEWARSLPGNALAALEQVVTRYPGTQVASLAVDDMAARAMEREPGLSHVAALEQARSNCSSPMAAACIDVAIATAYWRDLGNADAARNAAGRALDCDNPGVVAMARRLIDDIDSGR